jgi:lipopolysaccharide export system protein LptA
MVGGTSGVVLTQCKNVLKGDRLSVDMTTGVSRVESDTRVIAMLPQGGDNECASKTGSPLGANKPK